MEIQLNTLRSKVISAKYNYNQVIFNSASVAHNNSFIYDWSASIINSSVRITWIDGVTFNGQISENKLNGKIVSQFFPTSCRTPSGQTINSNAACIANVIMQIIP